MSAPASRRIIVEDQRVPMRDGVALATDIATVEGTRRPALLIRGPYSRAASRQAHDPVLLARDGWAVVVQDVRGRFDSEGTFEAFTQEVDDGADTIDWVARQRWCDGRVAMAGGSYLGLTQWMAALARPQALRAIAPSVIGSSVRDDWIEPGGAFQLGFVAPWALGVTTGNGAEVTPTTRAAMQLVRDMDTIYRAPLARHPLRALSPTFDRWLAGTDRGYWNTLDLARHYARLDVPSFQVAGWYDAFLEGSLRSHAGMTVHAASDYARASQRLIIGPWVHAGVLQQMTGEYDFGAAADGLLEDIPGESLRWLRRAVDRRPVRCGVRAFVVGGNRWVELPSWPPPSEPRQLFLTATTGANSVRGDGALAFDPPQDAGSDRLPYDPDDPVPTWGGRLLGMYVPAAGPVDQARVEARDDVLVYTSPPLRRGLTIAGPVRATIHVTSDARSADIVVKVCDVGRDGRAFNLVDGVRRTAITPGRARAIEVEVGSIMALVRRGHRIRVHIAASSFPRYDRNPSTGEPPHSASDLRPATHRVHHGGRRASVVTLPVLR